MVQWNSFITDTIENKQFAIIARCSTVATSIRISGRGGSSGHLTKIWVCLSTSVPFWMKYWISKTFHSHNVYLWMIWKFFSTTELPVFTILYYLQDHRQYNIRSTINIHPSKCLKIKTKYNGQDNILWIPVLDIVWRLNKTRASHIYRSYPKHEEMPVLLFLLAIVCLETSSIALRPLPRSPSLAPKVYNSYKLLLALSYWMLDGVLGMRL